MPCRPDEKMCFKCGEWFDIKDFPERYRGEGTWETVSLLFLCECGQYTCPHCGGCFCNVSGETKKAVHAMEQTYEKWIRGKGL